MSAKEETYMLYNLKYKDLSGESIMLRHGIKFKNRIQVNQYIIYDEKLLLVTSIKSLLIEAVELEGKVNVTIN